MTGLDPKAGQLAPSLLSLPEPWAGLQGWGLGECWLSHLGLEVGGSKVRAEEVCREAGSWGSVS